MKTERSKDAAVTLKSTPSSVTFTKRGSITLHPPTAVVPTLQRRRTLQKLLVSPPSRAVLPSSPFNTTTPVATCWSSPYVMYTCPILLWLGVATLFYNHHNDWSLCESFYYAVQSGLSIGFGVLTEDTDSARLFTIFHVLLGSLGITVMLSLLSESALAHVETRVRVEELNKLLLEAPTASSAPPSLCRLMVGGVITIEVIAAVVWLMVGTGFAYHYQKFTLIQSV